MNKIKTLSCIMGIMLSASAMAKVTIEIPDTIKLLVVNGEKPQTSGRIFSANKTVDLEDGEQQIVFRYQPYFTQGSDRVRVESDVIVATFQAQDQVLAFDMPQYRNALEAEKNIKMMEWSLQDKNNTTITMRQDRLIKPGMQIGRDYPQEIFKYNLEGGPAAISTTLGSSVSTMTVSGHTTDTTAEEMLHFWYNKADADTKARFKTFVNQ
ncbi:DUF2057 family protein [Vibrio cincinnatiensis]|uniref:DUF2057 family protein n=1 Tax=Vibrio cincinnatiensis TaxID=675 RepID=UPI001EE12C5F|nr:DUF2057 family protein [Vibrio cincinnatiensis]MCG3732807.1 DUF2057 domain-containing protein [Vibrio cincinnatiensis]MCG3739032.1 DUF2057 domain-containing protein [Vibrio cincinnatiensis]MCG3741912.1 DUF2057 domain-containing protein [Vibrio cincinnatiensis]MCG3758368.1 DUF2057 domain-containing protein [Vibrio cincinnatiensis]MCG3761665.1 DUF2057 domain-containing protein [Vibrio cincinnatiensis]